MRCVFRHQILQHNFGRAKRVRIEDCSSFVFALFSTLVYLPLHLLKITGREDDSYAHQKGVEFLFASCVGNYVDYLGQCVQERRQQEVGMNDYKFNVIDVSGTAWIGK